MAQALTAGAPGGGAPATPAAALAAPGGARGSGRCREEEPLWSMLSPSVTAWHTASAAPMHPPAAAPAGAGIAGLAAATAAAAAATAALPAVLLAVGGATGRVAMQLPARVAEPAQPAAVAPPPGAFLPDDDAECGLR